MTHSAGLPSRNLHECPDCGMVQSLPPMGRSAQATCGRCDATLRRTSRQSSDKALALVATSAVLYLVAMLSPFLSVDVVGQKTVTTVVSLPYAFVTHGAWELGLIVMVTAILAPMAKIGVMLTVLGGLRTANPPAVLAPLFKWYRRIGPWAMVEVFLLGVFVAFTRLGAIATVDVGVGLYAVAGLMVTMVTADYVLDPEEIWERMEARGLLRQTAASASPSAPLTGCHECGRTNQADAGEPCIRCRETLQHRKPNSVLNTWLLLIASALLYLPANIFPVLTVTRLGAGTPSTILGGAQELLDSGMWPLALLVFVASILVPMLKLCSLALMLITTQRGSAWRLRDRTRLYRMVEFIGRWSMIDVFMVATLVGLVHAGILADIEPGLGAICFGAVVVLTMLAASCFDPRLMWDAAGDRAQETQADPIGPAKPRAA